MSAQLVHAPLKPSQIATALICCIKSRQPVITWGAPGIGKSDVTRQTGAALNRKVIDVRASLLDPVDLRGIPNVRDHRTHWNAPAFLPEASDGPTLVLLDELNRAPVMTQNALFQLVLDRKLGEYTLPDTCEIVACCNREGDGGGVVKMPQALANRFTHLNMEPDLDDWCRWAIGANVEPAVIAFLRFRPDLLCKFVLNERAFPTPRSWQFVSRITGERPGNGIELALYTGAVGSGAAIEYAAFLQLFRDLPNIDAILLNPDTAAVPTKPATMFAVSSALARRASVTNLGRVLQFVKRLPQEYGVFCMKDAVRRDTSLQATPDFTKWGVENSSVIF